MGKTKKKSKKLEQHENYNYEYVIDNKVANTVDVINKKSDNKGGDNKEKDV